MARELDPHSSARAAFAIELLKHRKRAQLSQAALARQLNCDQSLVSHIERGERVAQRGYAEALDQIFGLTKEKVFAGLYERIVREARGPRWSVQWAEEVEPRATVLRTWAPLVMPGLLQTECVAREIFTTSPSIPPDRVEEQVRVRMRRRLVFEREEPPAIWDLIDEGVLHRPLGGIYVHLEQLRHLLEMSQLPNVTVQIVPLSAACAPGLMGAFALAEALGRVDALLVESTAGGQVSTDSLLIAQHQKRYDTIRAEAYPAKQSQRTIKDAIDRWNTQS